MLKIGEVSEWAKNRVIDIISEGGISPDTLQMCAVGLASDKVAHGVHIEDHNDSSQVQRILDLAPDSIEEYNNNIIGYSRLALTIYAHHVVEEETEKQITRIFGPTV